MCVGERGGGGGGCNDVKDKKPPSFFSFLIEDGTDQEKSHNTTFTQRHLDFLNWVSPTIRGGRKKF